jgi:hypothetical protein
MQLTKYLTVDVKLSKLKRMECKLDALLRILDPCGDESKKDELMDEEVDNSMSSPSPDGNGQGGNAIILHTPYSPLFYSS